MKTNLEEENANLRNVIARLYQAGDWLKDELMEYNPSEEDHPPIVNWNKTVADVRKIL